MDVAQVLVAVSLAAVVVQKFTEFARDDFGLPSGAFTRAFAAALGIVVAFAADFQALTVLFESPVNEFVDTVFTGVGIGAGAGFFNEVQS